MTVQKVTVFVHLLLVNHRVRVVVRLVFLKHLVDLGKGLPTDSHPDESLLFVLCESVVPRFQGGVSVAKVVQRLRQQDDGKLSAGFVGALDDGLGVGAFHPGGTAKVGRLYGVFHRW